MKTIQVSEINWKRLMKWRIDLDCKNMDELIDRVTNIFEASEVKE